SHRFGAQLVQAGGVQAVAAADGAALFFRRVWRGNMAIDRNTVRHVARLARLALTAEEEERTAAQLGHVLEYIERLEAVDISGVAPLSFAGDASEAEAVMRDDAVRPSLPREKVLAEAPEQDGSAFVVPRILE